MDSLSNFRSPINVKLDQLLLDPNNPRFAELDDAAEVIESRFNEPRIQSETMNKMKADKLKVSELRDTIKTIGFLPMDRIIVRKWKQSKKDEEKYVIIEGNRRITALK